MERKCHWATKTDDFYLTFDMHQLGVYEEKIMINKVLSFESYCQILISDCFAVKNWTAGVGKEWN